MFENLVTNIRRKFSKTPEEIRENVNTDAREKSGFKRNLHLFKTKLFTKNENENVHVEHYDDTVLSPRAIGSAECNALTEIEWPHLADNNPNILEKFTRIVTLTDHAPYDKNVRVKALNHRITDYILYNIFTEAIKYHSVLSLPTSVECGHVPAVNWLVNLIITM